MRLLALSLLVLSHTTLAKPSKVARHKFLINAPEGWDVTQKEEDADPIKLAITSKDKTANVTVMVVTISNHESAASILNATDARRKMPKDLGNEKTKIAKELLTKIGADDGIFGRYAQDEVLQRAMVVTKDRRAYVIVGAYRKSKDQELSKVIDASMHSFRITQ